MHKALKIVLMTLLWVGVVAFAVIFHMRAQYHRATTKVHSVEIILVDSLRDKMLIESRMVREWLKQSKIPTIGQTIEQVDLMGIEHAIRQNGFVERASAYVTYGGVLCIEVSERRPAMRLMLRGYDSYLTADGYIFPSPRFASAYVPIITGDYTPPLPAKYVGSAEEYIKQRMAESNARIDEIQLEKIPLFKRENEIKDSVKAVARMRVKRGLLEEREHFDERVERKRDEKAALRRKYRYWNRENEKAIASVTARQEAERDNQKKLQKRYEDFLKLINFVNYIEDDTFWRAEVVQIVASTMSSGEIELELIPRSGSHRILFGTLDNIEAKLDRLLTFYEKGLKELGWEEFRTISVQYQGQVVCTK